MNNSLGSSSSFEDHFEKIPVCKIVVGRYIEAIELDVDTSILSYHESPRLKLRRLTFTF